MDALSELREWLRSLDATFAFLLALPFVVAAAAFAGEWVRGRRRVHHAVVYAPPGQPLPQQLDCRCAPQGNGAMTLFRHVVIPDSAAASGTREEVGAYCCRLCGRLSHIRRQIRHH